MKQLEGRNSKSTEEVNQLSDINNKKRELCFDIAKGIGIILMIIGHCGIKNQYVRNFIYSFHMPLFFLISGYFFKYREDKELLKRNFKRLIIPYIITCLCIIMYKIFRLLLDKNFIEILETTKKWGLASLYGSGSYEPFGIRYIGAIWFLWGLFFSLYFVNVTRKSKYQCLWIVIIAYIGYKTSQYIWLPLSIQAGMVASIFVYLGLLARKNDIFNKKISKLLIWAIVLIVIFCTVYCGKLYMVKNYYKNGFLDIIGALSASFLCIKLSQVLEKRTNIIKKVLAVIGENSLIVLCLHLFALTCLRLKTVHNIMNNMGIEILSVRKVIIHILWVAISLTIIKLIIKIINKIKNGEWGKNKGKEV